MGLAQRAVLVLREQLKSCALISFALLSYWGARQSVSWIDPIWMSRLGGLENDELPMTKEI
jgi:hypothetical protein